MNADLDDVDGDVVTPGVPTERITERINDVFNKTSYEAREEMNRNSSEEEGSVASEIDGSTIQRVERRRRSNETLNQWRNQDKHLGGGVN